MLAALDGIKAEKTLIIMEAVALAVSTGEGWEKKERIKDLAKKAFAHDHVTLAYYLEAVSRR